MEKLFNKLIKTFFILLFIFVLTSCKSPQATKQAEGEHIQRLSTIEQEMNQTVAEQVKKLISEHKSVTNVYAVNTFDSLVVAFELSPFARLRMHKISKQFTEQIKQMYPMFEPTISTDQKIVWELKKIEQKIKEQNATVDEIQLDIKRIIKLAKDNA